MAMDVRRLRAVAAMWLPSVVAGERLPLRQNRSVGLRTGFRDADTLTRYTEPGAAWYELRLLAGSLTHGEQVVVAPRRRVRRGA
jgi:hypothetical protein